MYYSAKGLELLGMTLIGVGFIIEFPGLMNPKMLLAGIVFFVAGWVIEKYILQLLSVIRTQQKHRKQNIIQAVTR